jgi:hypothetical protein
MTNVIQQDTSAIEHVVVCAGIGPHSSFEDVIGLLATFFKVGVHMAHMEVQGADLV